MASFCPKCGYKLSMVDIKPECPVCNVNLVYYGMEENLNKEADKAEFEHALLQPHFDRLKAATIGSTVSKIRIVTCILPLLATLLPMGKVAVSLPFSSEDTTINIIAIITKVFLKLDFDQLLSMFGSGSVGTAYIFYIIALLSFVVVVLMTLLNVVFLVMSCGKRGIKRNITVASIGLAFAVIGQTAVSLWISMVSKAVPEIFSGSVVIWGGLAVALAFASQIVINVIYKKKNIKVKYTDVSQFLISYDERDHSNEEEDATVTAEV